MKTDSQTKTFEIVVVVEEGDTETQATATIDIADQHYGGWGRAKRSPGDPQVRSIGEELAIARACSDLAHKLLDAAAAGIEGYEGHEVNPHL